MNQRFDVLAFGAHPDDVEVAMGGTIAKLSEKGLTTLLVDICDGEPTRHANRGTRHAQAAEAARILGATRVTLAFAGRECIPTTEQRPTSSRTVSSTPDYQSGMR